MKREHCKRMLEKRMTKSFTTDAWFSMDNFDKFVYFGDRHFSDKRFLKWEIFRLSELERTK